MAIFGIFLGGSGSNREQEAAKMEAANLLVSLSNTTASKSVFVPITAAQQPQHVIMSSSQNSSSPIPTPRFITKPMMHSGVIRPELVRPTGKNEILKNREINWIYLCLQHFDKYWMWGANTNVESWLETLVKSHFNQPEVNLFLADFSFLEPQCDRGE